MSNGEKVKIGEAKGRPMLHWVGKQPLDYVKSFPAQKVEVFNPLCEENEDQGLLFHGDNKDVLAWLLANGYRGQVDLIYIDPPFDSGADYVRNVQLRGVRTSGLESEYHSLDEQIQYTDIWAKDLYLQFLYERLLLLKEILAPEGYITIHMNSNRIHGVKIILDEVFGDENFRNEIIVKRIRKSYTEPSGIRSLNEGCDYILLYSKSTESKFSPPLKYDPKDERWHGFDAPNIRPNLTYELFGKIPPPGRCWMRSQEEAEKMIEEGDLRPSPGSGWPEYRLPATNYIVRDSLWDDITASAFSTGYPTEKKESMLELLLEMTSDPGDLVLDCFIGSGTTAAVAQKLGRRWIAADINKGAIQTTSKRLQSIIQQQIIEQEKLKQGKLNLRKDEDEKPAPVSLSFSVYRVNDYDLQIQHNEAAKLAIEHIGIEEIKSDSFFDGTLGEKLVKIIPFNHPLTLLDLQIIKDEIETRDDQRDIVVVALGKETRADPWLKEYNDHRPINRIKVIELRTDEKYGKFFEHRPAQAKVIIERKDDKIIVDIEDFISPTIVERLEMDTPIFKAQIPDWRSMVDCVMIDLDYDGEAFNIDLSDVPEKKDDLVVGHYELSASKDDATIVLKIIDMLGEEVLISK